MGLRDLATDRLTGVLPIDSRGEETAPSLVLPMSAERCAPSMLAPRELNYIHWLASQTSGYGNVVELGCFLGGSTSALCEGLSISSQPDAFIHVYDSFESPDESVFTSSPELATYGIRPNESFRKQYEHLHQHRLHRLHIHEGRLPEYVTGCDTNSLYPSDQPIELLFVDIAKSWRVHVTVLHAFARHVVPGGIVVQQDFGDFRLPWIPIHMWQLREFFEPLDLVYRAPTLSFRCVKPVPEDMLARALLTPDSVSSAARERMWDDVVSYWSQYLGEKAGHWLAGHRAVHAQLAKDNKAALQHAESHELWRWTNASRDVFISPDWTPWLDALPSSVTQSESRERAENLVRYHRGVNSLPTPDRAFATWKTDAIKQRYWQQIEDLLCERHCTHVVLYGAGRHTRWLLQQGWPTQRLKLVCIVDDNPAVDAIEDIPVYTPDEVPSIEAGNVVVLPSSDGYESVVIERAKLLASKHGWDVVPVYTNESISRVHHDDAATHIEIKAQLHTTSNIVTHVQADEIDPAPVHRAQLGLKRERPWIDQLCKNAGWPAWARGHINSRDAAFIWDMLELTKPDTVIEIGVASGVSTATFTLGLHLFSAQHKQPMVHAYDLTRTCYFDPTHAVGAAVQDICPVLADSVNVRTQTTAREAAMDHVPGSVQLAMIDADHRHPAATVDLMALLPVLAPGAWVLLHDIELDHIHQQAGDADIVETGPKQLFDAWPFAKVRELMDNPADSNIGAIQLPASVRDAIDVLVEIADQPVLHQPCEMVR